VTARADAKVPKLANKRKRLSMKQRMRDLTIQTTAEAMWDYLGCKW